MLFNNTKFTTRLSVLVVLGCSLLVATSSSSSTVGAANIPESVKKAAEAQVVAATTESPCVDAYILKSECIEWAWWGECDKNKAFMHDQCRQSCGLCTPTEDEEEKCTNHLDTCTEWAEKGNKKVDNLCHGHWNSVKDGKVITGAYVVEMCPAACKACGIHLDDRDIDLGIGLPQSFDGMDTEKELFNLLKGKVAEIRTYVESIEDDAVREVCKMSHPNCARFALSSDCESHFDHPVMKYGCAAACKTCENLVNDNGIFEARHMWATALREFREQKELAHQTISATM